MNTQNRPTEKMQNALRAYKIPEAEIQKMSFEQARSKINELIEASKAKKLAKANKVVDSSQKRTEREDNPLPNSSSIDQVVSKRLADAISITKSNIPDAEDRSEYLTLVQEVAHQLFAEASMQRIQSYKERNMKGI